VFPYELWRTKLCQATETGTLLGRASIAGLEKAVEVLDTLGSSMTNLNPGSGFLSGGTNRGNKVCILAFEVANTIAKSSSLWNSCSDESIKELKEEILHSDGVRILVSTNSSELLHIAAVDKRYGHILLKKTQVSLKALPWYWLVLTWNGIWQGRTCHVLKRSDSIWWPL
jgi:hypothetical protein